MRNSGLKRGNVCTVMSRIEKMVSKGVLRAPAYSPADALGVLLYTSTVGAAGRISISRCIGLGEQATRTLIRDLELEGLIKRDRRGVKPAEDVSECLKSIVVNDLIPSPSFLGWRNTVVLQIEHKSLRLSNKDIIRIRDAVVRWGGEGAVILLKRRGDPRLTLPFLERSEHEEELNNILRQVLVISEGLVSVMGYSSTLTRWYPVYGFLEEFCRLLQEQQQRSCRASEQSKERI